MVAIYKPFLKNWHRCNMAEILPIRRKTLLNNQSIRTSIAARETFNIEQCNL